MCDRDYEIVRTSWWFYGGGVTWLKLKVKRFFDLVIFQDQDCDLLFEDNTFSAVHFLFFITNLLINPTHP